MADLISRAAAIEAMQECWRRVNQFAKPFEANRIMDCIKAVKDLPAVDAAPVVRCKDCKFGKLCIDADGHSLIQCNNPNYPTANVETWPLELDWYCAGGERRDGDA